jgi:hypothetical protein
MPPTPARAATRSSEGRSAPRPPKPAVLRPNFDRVPRALRQHARWVLWRLEWSAAASKWTKVPHRADGRGKASTTNADTWAPFDTARAAFEAGTANADGVGFVIGEGIVGGDVDHCRDTDGHLTPEASTIVAELRTYTELSPSAATPGEGGIRYFARGALPAAGRKRGNFEMYDGGRYLTVTGHQLTGTPASIEERTPALATIHARHIAAPARPAPNGEARRPPATGKGAHLSDADVLERMRRAKPEAGALYDGDMTAHADDHSAADLALCSHLAWWTDYDATQTDRLFRASALMRPKWTRKVTSDGELYGDRTIRTAMEGKRPGDGYRPSERVNLGRNTGDPMADPAPDIEPPPDLPDDLPPDPNDAPVMKGTKNAPKPIAKPPKGRPKPPTLTLDELLTTEYPPLRPVVADMIVPGLNVLAGKPKLGKSWLALQMCIAVARGSKFFNRATERGRAYYFGLEDSPRRLQSRVIHTGEDLTELRRTSTLNFGTELQRLDRGGLDQLSAIMDEHQDVKLIVLDTLARVKPAARTTGTAYDSDSEFGGALQRWALDRDVALLVVTHLRKLVAEDPLDQISGSVGVPGTADSVLVLQRERGQADAVLIGASRDLGERKDALRFDGNTGTWTMLGDAAEYALTNERRLILEAVRELGTAGPTAVADFVGDGVKVNSVRQLMAKMVNDGTLASNGRGQYRAPTRDSVANVAFVAQAYRDDD